MSHVDADDAAPKAAGKQPAQRRGPGQHQQHGRDDFAPADELQPISKSGLCSLVYHLRRGEEDFHRAGKQDERRDQDVQHDAHHFQPFVLRIHWPSLLLSVKGFSNPSTSLHARSKSITSAACSPTMVRWFSSLTARPSLVSNVVPWTLTWPRKTWSQAWRPGPYLMAYRFAGLQRREIDPCVLVDGQRAFGPVRRGDQTQLALASRPP